MIKLSEFENLPSFKLGLFYAAIGGMNVTYTVEGLERYPVNLRYNREFRDNIDMIKRVMVPTPSGAQIPLTQLASISIHKGPAGIKSENSKRTAWVYVDIKNVDLGTYVKNAKKLVDEKVKIPTGYSIIWSGQFEYMEKARKTLNVIVPVTLGIIFLLLFIHFGNIIEVIIVMASLPFALLGGIWLIYLLDYNMSVATTLIGLLPVMVGTGAGSQIMKRIAAPMVGGLVSSTVMTLIIIPVIYNLWKTWEIKPKQT